MKRALFIIAALLAGAVLATGLRIDAGYVAVSFLGVLIETSFISFILLMLAAYVLLWALLRLVRMRRLRRQAQAARSEQRARADLARGVLEMAEGNLAAAELTVTRGARALPHPEVNYLIAARAADLQGALERRDGWLRMAREAAPDEVAPVLVTQAEMQLKQGQFDGARDTLQQLDASGQQNPRGLLLLARLYRQQRDFVKLRSLESKLRGARGIRPAAVDELMDQAYLEMLRVAAESGDPAQLDRVWNDASRPATRRPDIVVAYASGAMRAGNHTAAEKVLRDFLDAGWDDRVAAAYGEVEIPDALMPLAMAERWLKTRRDDAVLLVACARLCLRAEIYGRARSYLEASLAMRRDATTCQLLGNLLDQMGEKDKATEVLQQGLVLALGRRANLPKLKLRRLQAARMGGGSRQDYDTES